MTTPASPVPAFNADDWDCPVCGSGDLGLLDDPDYTWKSPPETICRVCGFAAEDEAFRITADFNPELYGRI